MDFNTYRKTYRQTDRHADRWTETQADRNQFKGVNQQGQKERGVGTPFSKGCAAANTNSL